MKTIEDRRKEMWLEMDELKREIKEMENINRLIVQIEENTINHGRASGLVNKEYYNTKVEALRAKLHQAIRRL